LLATVAPSAHAQGSFSFVFSVSGSGYGTISNNVGTSAPGTLVGDTASLGFAAIREQDTPTSTSIFVVSDDAYGDYIAFYDSAPAANDLGTGRSGTAKVTYGTGLFQGAVSGSISYTRACVSSADNCAGTGTGVGQFTYTLSGNGTVNFAAGNFMAGSPGLPPLVLPCGTSAGFDVATTDGGTPVIVAADGSGSGGAVLYPPAPLMFHPFLPRAGGGVGNGVCPCDGSGSAGNVNYPPAPLIFHSFLPHSDGGGGIGICPNEGSGAGGNVNYPPAPRAATPAANTYQPIGITPPWQLAPANYTATATCPGLPAGSCFVTIPAPSGAIPAFTTTTIEADVSAAGLAPGVYTANVAVSLTLAATPNVAPSVNNVPVMLIVGNGAPLVQISETAIAFQSAATHAVLLSSSGADVPYAATASTLGGGSWLSVSPNAGTASSTASSTVNISANPAGLAAGNYFGRVDIGAPGALNGTQSIEVELTVAATPNPTPVLSTTGLIFSAAQNTNPASQTFTISTASTTAIAMSVGAEAQNLGSWLKVTGSAAAVAAGTPITATVKVNTSGLAAGIYTGSVVAQNTATSAQYPVAVVLIVTASGTCTPTELLPVFTNLTPNFEFTAAQPVTIQANIADDCGNALTSGTVQASFGTGDDLPVGLTAVGNGLWSGTWLPHAVAGASASVALVAESSTGLAGFTSASGTLDANPSAAVVTPGGIVNAASLVSGAPLAPGEFLSIFGTNLASGAAPAPSAPYTTSLNGTQVLLGGQPLPLQFVGANQINALVPFGTPANTIQELLVEQNGVYSLPETVVVAPANPAVFTQSQSGQGAGAIIVVKANGTEFVASATQPASVGDVLAIYCSGLGAVSPPVPDGSAAPLSSLSKTVNTVTATIGGLPATVSFAGLAPGFVGLYQVNATVPAGVTAGANVPVILTTEGSSSVPITVAIQ
jgi:uncharacterized protein (TIGR03437 family)